MMNDYILQKAKLIDQKLMNLLNLEKLIEKENLTAEDIKNLLIASAYDNLYAIFMLLAGLVTNFGDEELKKEFFEVFNEAKKKLKNLDINIDDLFSISLKLTILKDKLLKNLGILKMRKEIKLEDLI